MNEAECKDLDRLIDVSPSEIKLKRRVKYGGLSDIWLAAHPDISVPFAVKYSRYACSDNPYIFGQFEREFECTKRLFKYGLRDCTNYIINFDIDIYEHPFLYIEYFHANSLNDMLCETWTWPQMREVMLQIINEIYDIHQAGVVHRDIKPSNIMVNDSGKVRIIDFALSTIDGISHRYHQDGSALGTPLYMSPEQACGQTPIPACDWYSLGVTLYEWMTGNVPFRGVDAAQTMHMHCEYPVPWIHDQDVHIIGAPSWLRSHVRALLDKAPEARHEAAASLFEKLHLDH